MWPSAETRLAELEGGGGGGGRSRASACSAPQYSYAQDEALAVKRLRLLAPAPGLLTPMCWITNDRGRLAYRKTKLSRTFLSTSSDVVFVFVIIF